MTLAASATLMVGAKWVPAVITDLYKLSTVIYHNNVIMNILNKSYAEIFWDIGSKKVFTTNNILNQNGNIGGKTGNTQDAGQCFLGITKDGNVTIVLNSLDRFTDTKNLLIDLQVE